MTPYYVDELVTIYHGDSREVLPGLAEATGGGIMVTDPPYGRGYARDAIRGDRKHRRSTWDVPLDAAFVGQLLGVGRGQIIWGGNYYALPPTPAWLVWVKPDALPSMATCELAWTSLERPARHLIQSISATNAERVGHPTQKPLRVMRWCIGMAPGEGPIVDPFMGSGSTLVAAKSLNRPAIGIELDERFCELAASRLAQGVLGLEIPA